MAVAERGRPARAAAPGDRPVLSPAETAASPPRGRDLAGVGIGAKSRNGVPSTAQNLAVLPASAVQSGS